MQIVSNGEYLHEMPKPVFLDKNNNKKKKLQHIVCGVLSVQCREHTDYPEHDHGSLVYEDRFSRYKAQIITNPSLYRALSLQNKSQHVLHTSLTNRKTG